MDNASTTAPPEVVSETASVPPARLVVFAVLAVGFLTWVMFGQVEARVWVSGQLTLINRHIASMWQYLGNNLPDLPMPAAFSAIYWLSISFVVIGTVAGLWLFLGTSDEDANSLPLEVIHAAHIQHDAE